MSLAERRNSAQEEESIPEIAKTPTSPIKKEPTPPPMPPRLPNDLASPHSTSSTIFSFDVPPPFLPQSAPPPVEDKPPPIPPRDDIPLPSQYVEPEPEFFHNADMLRYHQPMSYGNQQQSVFNFGDFHHNMGQLGHSERTSFSARDLSYSVTHEPSHFVYPTPYPNNVPVEDRAPPVPPREPLREPAQVPLPPRDAPAVPPRDPPVATPPYDTYASRYVPDPTRFASTSRYPDAPPPVPRRQPSAQNF